MHFAFVTHFVEISAVGWNVVVVDACLLIPCASIFHFAALAYRAGLVARNFLLGI